jgi:murein DD-endopeptidase MepM/ murein hydrolase activator NlpD
MMRTGSTRQTRRARLAVTVLACLLLSASSAAARSMVPAERTNADVIGVSISHPAKWSVERERYTFDKTYGFTLWKPEPDPATHDHGGTPTIRVALAYDLQPEQIEATVRDTIAAYPNLPLTREEVSVGQKGREGVAVGPIPGSTPSTEVYVPVNGRVYLINVYGVGLDAKGRELLSSLRFDVPSRSIRSLGLPAANAPEVLYAPGGSERAERERAAHEAAAEDVPEAATVAQAGETEIEEGCWSADDPGFFFQTQHGPTANSRPGDGIPTGYTIVGRPNYWDEYTHGALGPGYGRCVKPFNTNDKFAVDYPFNRGDAFFSPFARGTVTFAGRNRTHRDYGILVSIRAANGKYVSLSAHLNKLASGIRRGTEVDEHTVIGYAGNTGGPAFPVGEPHLHQAYYRDPSYSPDGSPYGGAGLQVVFHRYVGTAAGTGPGVYKFDWRSDSETVSKGDRISN